MAALWHKHWQTGKSARHVDVVWRRMEADIFPALGTRPVDEIEAPELVAMIKAIEKRGSVMNLQASTRFPAVASEREGLARTRT